MASGVEMMMKALGIDPEEIKRSMFETIERLQTGIKGLDERLSAIDAGQRIINARLERLEIHLGIVPSGAEIPQLENKSGAAKN